MAKILLVDDTVTVIMATKLLLSGQGYEIKTAYNGKDALNTEDLHQFDLIITDIMMPVMDGLEFIRCIREGRTAISEIPIIVATTQGQETMMEECFKAGCNDFVTKPINRKELLHKIKRLLEKRS